MRFSSFRLIFFFLSEITSFGNKSNNLCQMMNISINKIGQNDPMQLLFHRNCFDALEVKLLLQYT